MFALIGTFPSGCVLLIPQPKCLKILRITPRSKKDGRSKKLKRTLGLRHEVKGEYCSLRFDTVALVRSCRLPPFRNAGSQGRQDLPSEGHGQSDSRPGALLKCCRVGPQRRTGGYSKGQPAPFSREQDAQRCCSSLRVAGRRQVHRCRQQHTRMQL